MAKAAGKKVHPKKAMGRVKLTDHETTALAILAQKPSARARHALLSRLDGRALRVAKLLSTPRAVSRGARTPERQAARSLLDWAHAMKAYRG